MSLVSENSMDVFQPIEETNDAARHLVVNQTLLIGIGGTGAEVVSQVKRGLDRIGTHSHVKVLVIDSDQNSQNGSHGFQGFKKDEFVYLPVDEAKSILDDPNEHEHIIRRIGLARLEKRSVLSKLLSTGLDQAGQVRQIGLLTLLANYQSVKQNISSKISELTGVFSTLESDRKRPGIHRFRRRLSIVVVCSNAGGTGSGMALELLAMIRNMTESNLTRQTVIVIEPDVFESSLSGKPEEQERIKVSADHFYREFDLFQRNDPIVQSIELGQREDDAVTVRGGLAHRVYTIGRKTSGGGDLQTRDRTLSMVATYLLSELGTEMSTRFDADDSNDGTVRELAPDSRTGKPRYLGTFNATAIGIDAQAMAKQFANKQSLKLLEEAVIGNNGGDSRSTSLAKSWLVNPLESSAINLCGAKTVEFFKILVPINVQGLTAPVYQRTSTSMRVYHSNKQFSGAVQGVCTQFDSSHLPTIVTKMSDQSTKQISLLVESLNQKAGEIAQENGLLVALRFLLSVQKQLDQLRASLQNEVEIDRAQYDSLAKQIQTQSKSLKGRFSADRSGQDTVTQKLQLSINCKITSIAKETVIHVLESIGAHSGELISKIEAALDTANSRLQKIRQQGLDSSEPGLCTFQSHVELDLGKIASSDALFERMSLESKHLLSKIQESRKLTGIQLLTQVVQDDELFEQLENGLVRHFTNKLSKISILEILDNLLNDPKTSERAEARISTALDACQPAWRADPKSIHMSYMDRLVIGLPISRLPSQAQRVIDKFRELAGNIIYRGQKIQADFVDISDPHRIYITRRVNGARPEHLIQVQENYRASRQWSLKGKMVPSLFNESIQARIPSVVPTRPAEDRELAAVISMAYGWIVKRGDWWHANIDRVNGTLDKFVCPLNNHFDCLTFRDEKLKIQSRLIQHMIANGSLTYLCSLDLPKGSKLGEDLAEAVQEFETNGELLELVQDAYNSMLSTHGPTAISEDMIKYEEMLRQFLGGSNSTDRLFVRHLEVLQQLISKLKCK